MTVGKLSGFIFMSLFNAEKRAFNLSKVHSMTFLALNSQWSKYCSDQCCLHSHILSLNMVAMSKQGHLEYTHVQDFHHPLLPLYRVHTGTKYRASPCWPGSARFQNCSVNAYKPCRVELARAGPARLPKASQLGISPGQLGYER